MNENRVFYFMVKASTGSDILRCNLLQQADLSAKKTLRW